MSNEFDGFESREARLKAVREWSNNLAVNSTDVAMRPSVEVNIGQRKYRVYAYGNTNKLDSGVNVMFLLKQLQKHLVGGPEFELILHPEDYDRWMASMTVSSTPLVNGNTLVKEKSNEESL